MAEIKTSKRKYTNTHKSLDHNPQEESTQAVFGDPKAKGDEFTPHVFK